MKQQSLLLVFNLIILTVFAQRPDSVQVNGEWFFVYPLHEKLQPSDILLDKLDLSEVQFELFKDWKLAGDPRLNLSKNKMIDSLNAELIRTKIIVSKSQNRYRWRNDTKAPKLVRALLLRKKHWYRNNSELLVDREIDQNYDLVPAVQNLPNGKYIQYFEPMLSYHEWKKTKVLPTKVAAMFELKNNLLENEFTRFNYRGDTIRHGYFTDGLKEKQWKLYDRGTYLSHGLHGFAKRNTLFLYKSWIKIELKKGILDGPYWNDDYNSHKPLGYFKNGYADSSWIIKPYYSWRSTEVFDYNSVLDSNYIQQLSMTICPGFSTYRKYTKGFDFKEKKNDYHSTYYYDCQEDRYQQGVPAIPLTDFADLFEHPTKSGLSRLRTANQNGTGNYRNTGHVNFHGTKEVFDQNQLAERYTYLPELGTIVFARFFKSGAVFDTLGFDPRDSVFVHNVFDANGKIYQTTTYNTSGETIKHTNYYQEKEEKIKYETPMLIEGFETMSDYHSGKKFRSWKGDLIIDGKHYTDIEWYAKTKKRSSETYIDTSDLSVYDVIYNSKEEAVVEHVHFLVTLDSQGDQNTVKYGSREIVNIGNVKLTQEKVRDVKSQVVLTSSGQPYSGKMDIHFSDDKLNLEDQVIDGLQWTIPWDETAKSLHKQFVELYVSDNDFPMFTGYNYYLQEKDYGNLFSHLMGELFHGQFGLYVITRMEGDFQNGQPSGNWNYYDKKGTVIFTLNFVNGLPNGEAAKFTDYKKPSHYDRKYDQDQPYYSFLYSKEAPKTYREQTYRFVNGKLDGPHVVYTAMGDTMKLTEYKLGEFHGRTWERLEDKVSQKEYLNGKSHGIALTGNLEYNDKRELVMDTISFAHYENGRLQGDCYFEFYENEDEDEDYGGGDRIQVSHYRTFQVQKNVRCHFQQGLLQGNYVQRKESGETEFTISLNKGLVDTITFFENGAPSYYYDYAEEERLLPYRFSDTVALHLGSRFFYNSHLSYLTYDESEDDETRYGRMARENPYGRSGFGIDDYKQGRFTKLYPNGKIARRGYRIDDKNWGDWDFYNYEGQPLYSIDYGTQTVVLNGVTYSEAEIKGDYTEYDSLGNEICKGFLIEELEKYDCAHADYYAIRQYVIIEDREDGFERTNGPMRYYFDNGMLMSEGTLKNGMPDGVWKFYTPDGKLTRIGKYVNGKKEGRWLRGDLGDKKYIGEICLNPDDPLLDFHIAELERLRDVEIVIYKNGLAQIRQEYEVTD
jgi:antitoxin component YwqK of YwqJK toxin-antitoxin module